MSIVESDGPPSWSLDASKTGESTKCLWVGVVEVTAGEKNRETVTTSLCLMFNGCGRVLAPPQIKSINDFLSWRKNLSDRGNMISITCGFETFLNSRSSSERALLTKSTQCSYKVESNECGTKELFSDSDNVSKGCKSCDDTQDACVKFI